MENTTDPFRDRQGTPNTPTVPLTSTERFGRWLRSQLGVVGWDEALEEWRQPYAPRLSP